MFKIKQTMRRSIFKYFMYLRDQSLITSVASIRRFYDCYFGSYENYQTFQRVWMYIHINTDKQKVDQTKLGLLFSQKRVYDTVYLSVSLSYE